MKIYPPYLSLLLLLTAFSSKGHALKLPEDSLSRKTSLIKRMAEDLIKNGFTTGDGYGEVWIRDFNTFINVSSAVNDKERAKKYLITFLKFQQSDGSILIRYGYIAEAKEALVPMLDRGIKDKGFYEWYTTDNIPKGSLSFRGVAGVLWTAISQLNALT